MTTQVTIRTTHELGYAASRLLLYAEPTDRALIGWQPFSGAGATSIGGWEHYCKDEAQTIVNAANGRST
jgi:hypothetical protein